MEQVARHDTIDLKKPQTPAYAFTERNNLTVKNVDKIVVSEKLDRRKSRHKNKNIIFLPVV